MVSVGDKEEKEQGVVKSQAKGTGYSSYQNKEARDVKAYMAAQKEKDKQIQLVLGENMFRVEEAQGDVWPELLGLPSG